MDVNSQKQSTVITHSLTHSLAHSQRYLQRDREHTQNEYYNTCTPRIRVYIQKFDEEERQYGQAE